MRRTWHIPDGIGITSGRIPLISLVRTLAVAEHLNFRHAATALGVTQSSVSARIKALEETLGIVLFERRHRGVRLRAYPDVSRDVTHAPGGIFFTTVSRASNSRPEAERTRRGARGFPVLRSMRVE